MSKVVNPREPTVRIGIIQSTETVGFSVTSDFQLVAENGQVLMKGQRNRKYHLKIFSSKPATLNYQVRLALEKEQRQAMEKIQALEAKGMEAHLRVVGQELKFNSHTLDNREYWIVTGQFNSYDQAVGFQKKLPEAEETRIVEQVLESADGLIKLENKPLGSKIRIVPGYAERPRIRVSGVTVGIGFHWEHQESQEFRGAVEIGFNYQGRLSVINEIDLEAYLASVNSSEMTTDCPIELLKAQTVAARSTILATMGKHHYNENYHLCADDHCQCYRGTTYEAEASWQAVQETRGEILSYRGQACDARYAKICGGIREGYENVWESIKIPYLQAGIDGDPAQLDYPLDTEEKVRHYIDTSPRVYCNTSLYSLPPKLDFSKNLFRWELRYTRQQLEQIIRHKTGEDLGELLDIRPVARGHSGRLIFIELVGTKKTLKVGKELEIRRVLSDSHLYSSCFYVDKQLNNRGSVEAFVLKGAGWGHGVGLCQVGATTMASEGFSYKEILSHYYKGAELIKLY